MAWSKKKRDDGADELFSENARLERERKQGAIDDAQAMADASGTPEEELEVPKDTWGTVRRLWHAAAGERWRFGAEAKVSYQDERGDRENHAAISGERDGIFL